MQVVGKVENSDFQYNLIYFNIPNLVASNTPSERLCMNYDSLRPEGVLCLFSCIPFLHLLKHGFLRGQG